MSGSGAALGANRNTADAAATTAPHIPHAQTQSAATNAASISSAGIPVSVLASEQRQHEPASPQQVEELQHSLALIASQPESADTTLQILLKLLNNLSAAPKVRLAVLGLAVNGLQQGYAGLSALSEAVLVVVTV